VNLPATPPCYVGLIQGIAAAFDRALEEIQAEHNFELGDEFEVALCKVFRKVLPQRLGICRGFAINRSGQTAGDDILIYDRMRYPTARLLGEDLTIKENVPIEAIFAYVEAKHTLEIEGDTGQSLTRAIQQVRDVKTLCGLRAAVPLDQIADGVRLGESMNVETPVGWPRTRNPVYTAIMSRHVRLRSGQPHITDSATIKQHLMTLDLDVPLPDLIVAGGSNVVVPSYTDGNFQPISFSPFYIVPGGGLTVCVATGIAFGVAMAELLWALDYIHLGPMPWHAVVDSALLPENRSAQ
jgi:hypothetical protein